MTLSECACVKPSQSSLGALGHNTLSLLTTVASGTSPLLYTPHTVCVCVCLCGCVFLQHRHPPPCILVSSPGVLVCCAASQQETYFYWLIDFFFHFWFDSFIRKRPLQAKKKVDSTPTSCRLTLLKGLFFLIAVHISCITAQPLGPQQHLLLLPPDGGKGNRLYRI